MARVAAVVVHVVEAVVVVVVRVRVRVMWLRRTIFVRVLTGRKVQRVIRH